MRETGAITRPAGMGSTSMRMAINMKESGKTMFSTGMEKRDGLMAHLTRVHITKELSTV